MSKEMTMSISQFMEMERGNLALADISVDNGYENKVTKLFKNENFQFVVIMGTSCIFIAMATVPAIAAGTPVASIGGPISTEAFVSISKKAIYALCTATCTIETLKAVITKKYKEIPNIAFKYGTVFLFVWGIEPLYKILNETGKYLDSMGVYDVTTTISQYVHEVSSAIFK